jgi:hypothetical protein
VARAPLEPARVEVEVRDFAHLVGHDRRFMRLRVTAAAP